MQTRRIRKPMQEAKWLSPLMCDPFMTEGLQVLVLAPSSKPGVAVGFASSKAAFSAAGILSFHAKIALVASTGCK